MKTLAAFALSALLLTTCSSSDTTSDPGTENATLNLEFVPTTNAVEGLLKAKGHRFVAAAPAVGQTTDTSIESLQYFIQSIRLCSDLTIDGTGYSASEGCITVYENSDSSVLTEEYYNTYTVTEAAADTASGHYIDLLSSEGRSQLNQSITLTSDMVGTYKYGLINYMRPIKMKASFLSPEGEVVAYTKAPQSSNIVAGSTDSSGREFEYIRLDNAIDASAELMTYMLNNGGTWFPFVEPFTITEQDITDRAQIALDFVFNPVGFATASIQPGCADPFENRSAVDATNCVYFDLPYAKFSPLPRKANQGLKKEVYLVDYISSGDALSKLRVELYYNDADTSKSILGVDIASIAQLGATAASGNVVQALSATEDSSGVTFYGYNSSTGGNDAVNLSGLVRGTDGTLTIRCQFAGGPCTSDDGSELTRSYTYLGEFTVASGSAED